MIITLEDTAFVIDSDSDPIWCHTDMILLNFMEKYIESEIVVKFMQQEG